MSEREAILRYLETEFSEPVRDPVWKHIYLSDVHEKIISLPVFQELHDIKQLGPAYLVYPGATHTRFAHSLGTFHIAKRIMAGLAGRLHDSPFSLCGVKAFLAAALLHDLGHYPFAHALKNLGLEDHEVLTGRLVLEEPLVKIIRHGLGVEPERVAAIVDTTLPVMPADEVALLRRLLSGVLDPDKLDYLNRDAYYCGVPYGIQDVDFFLGEIILDREKGFALTPKGITAVENILFSKYLMYKTVYWHKTVRIATAMIKKALLLALRDGVIAADDLYLLTDRTLMSMIDTLRYRPFSLVDDVFSRRLYKQIVRVPFDPNNPGHRLLADHRRCLEREGAIAAELSRLAGKEAGEESVVIDIPEELRFEIDLSIAGEEGTVPFSATRHIFQAGGRGTSIAENLRSVSLYVRRDEALVRAAEQLAAGRDLFWT